MKERSCKRAKGLFSNHFDQDLTGPDADWLEGHLRNCPSCRKEFASYRSLFQSVRKLPAVQASSGFETRLYARMREEHGSRARASWWQ